MADRRRLHFSLSTLLLLSFAAGSLLYLNRVRDDTEAINRTSFETLTTEAASGSVIHKVWFKRRGWPFDSHALYVDGTLVNPAETYVLHVLNAGVALSMLATIGIGAECLIRRKAAPPSPALSSAMIRAR